MDIKIATAPHQVEVGSDPVIFLAGPIRGAAKWQTRAVELLTESVFLSSHWGTIVVANPRRPEFDGNKDFYTGQFNEQIDWEHQYLELARQRGVAIFWLAEEVDHRCDNPYAKTTRFELAEAAALGCQLVVGGDPSFPGLDYITYTLGKKYPNATICNSLEECCQVAFTKARKVAREP